MEGKDSRTVQKMEKYAKDPSEHLAYGYSGKWRTTMVNIASGLDKDAYECWLWKEERVSDGQYANLRNEVHFPSFENLPGDNDINMEYLGTTDGFHYSPIKNWCFLGEIIDVEAFLRLRLIVQDKAKHRIPIAFHTDERGQELDRALLQKGHTVAILYAEHHGFMDMTEGIRHETPSNLKVCFDTTAMRASRPTMLIYNLIQIFPTSLKDFLSLSDMIQQYSTIQGGIRTCQGCDEKATSLQKCSRCGLFWYCNKVGSLILAWQLKFTNSLGHSPVKLLGGLRGVIKHTASFSKILI